MFDLLFSLSEYSIIYSVISISSPSFFLYFLIICLILIFLELKILRGEKNLKLEVYNVTENYYNLFLILLGLRHYKATLRNGDIVNIVSDSELLTSQKVEVFKLSKNVFMYEGKR